MCRIFGVMVFGMLAFAPEAVWGQKKLDGNKKGADVSDANPKHYALLAQYREMSGTLRSLTPTSVVIRVEYNHPVPKQVNGNAGANNARPIVRRGNSSAQAFRQQLQQLQRAQANTKMDKDYLDFELPLTDKATFRRMEQGVEYDDKGNPKSMTAAQAKGAASLPGFAAKADDFSKGDHITVYLSPATGSATSPRKDDKTFGPDLALAGRPRVRLVVLESETDEKAIARKKK